MWVNEGFAEVLQEALDVGFLDKCNAYIFSILYKDLIKASKTLQQRFCQLYALKSIIFSVTGLFPLHKMEPVSFVKGQLISNGLFCLFNSSSNERKISAPVSWGKN